MKRIVFVASLLIVGLTGAACCFGGQGSFDLSGPTTALSPGFTPDPMLLTGTAGGPSDASTQNSMCRGFIPILPSHTLQLSAPMTLRVMAHSDVDTTLVVRLADGTYLCNDDSDGLDPVVEGSFPAGNHNVFVGTYSSSQTAPYTLGLTVNPALTPSTMSAPAAAPAGGIAPAGGGAAPSAGVCPRATECCNAYVAAMPAAAGTDCAIYATFAGGPAEAGCQSAIDGFRSGLTALGQTVPPACQ